MSEILPIHNNNKKSTLVIFFFLRETKGRFVPLDVWETIAGTLDKFHFLYYPESTAIDDAVHPSGYNLI